ncbi:MAG: AI-2E family transporter [Proteobacteria bacterium]|nr:MAG: AI-2E family transporter [Pseudomonadota bacterium]
MNKALQIRWSGRAQRIFLVAIFALYAMLFLPFWKEMIMGFIFASACAPALRELRSRLASRNNNIAYGAVIASVAILIAIVGIAAFQIYSVTYEIVSSPEKLAGYNQQLTGLRDSLLGWINNQGFLAKFGTEQKINQAVLTVSESARTWALASASAFLSAAPEILMSFAIFLGAFAAFLVIGERTFSTAAQIFQLKPAAYKHFLKFEKICGISLGSVVIIGTAQSFLVTIGAYISGYTSVFPVFVLTFVFSLVPVLGAGLMGAVLAVISLLQGDYTGAIIMGVTATIAGVADNVLRPWFFSRAAKTNPIFSLISLFGGVAIFGFAGLFIAPVLEQLAMTYVLLDREQVAEEPAAPLMEAEIVEKAS